MGTGRGGKAVGRGGGEEGGEERGGEGEGMEDADQSHWGLSPHPFLLDGRPLGPHLRPAAPILPLWDGCGGGQMLL